MTRVASTAADRSERRRAIAVLVGGVVILIGAWAWLGRAAGSAPASSVAVIPAQPISLPSPPAAGALAADREDSALVDKPDREAVGDSVASPEDDGSDFEEVDLDAESLGSLRVTFERGGEPVPFVDFVIAASWEGHRYQPYRTDASGVALLDGLATGKWRVRRDPIVRRDLVEILPETTTDLTLTLRAEPMGVAGVVTDAAGRPAAGALVTWHDDTGRISGQMRSSDDGGFAFEDLPATVALRAERNGWSGAAVISCLASGERAVVELPLEHRDRPLPDSDAGILRVDVRDAADRPVADAEFRLVRRTVEFASDDDALGSIPVEDGSIAGRYSIRGIGAGELSVDVSAPRLAPQRFEVRITGTETTSLEVRLAAAASIRGRVVGPDGGAIAHATVSAAANRGELEDRSTTRRFDRFTRTDLMGRFVIRGLPAGQCFVALEAAGIGRAESMFDLEEGESRLWGRVRLDPGLTLVGRVVDTTGAVLVDTELELRESTGKERHQAVTDARGEFRFVNLAQVSHRLTVNRSIDLFGGACWKQLDDVWPSPEPLQIEVAPFDAAVEVRGQLFQPDGTGAQGILLIAQSAELGAFVRTQVDRDGAFVFTGLPPHGEYEFTSYDLRRRYAPILLRRAELSTGDAVDLGTWTLEPKAEFEIRVDGSELPAGTAVRRAVFLDSDGQRIDTATVISGRVQPMRALGAGDYRFALDSPGVAYREDQLKLSTGVALEWTVIARPGISHQLHFDSPKPRVRRVRAKIRIRDQQGETICSRELSLEPDLPWTLSLAPGRYDLTADTEIGRSGTTTFVVGSEPGETRLKLR